ncbi:MAG: tetratricopeptide repeat protein [Elusimicrobia bacterium]|nr:tetratricopeptide repeat protein [Elusimicrobiota bacterium]
MKDLDTIIRRNEAYFEEGLFGRVIAGCGEAIEAGSESPLLYRLRAKAYVAKAREDAGRAPADEEAYEKWAEAFSRGPGLRLALEDARRAAELDPSDPETYFGLGIILMDLRDWTGGIAALDKCLELSPDDAEARYWKAVARDEMGEPDSALAELDGLLAADGEHADSFHFRSQLRASALDWEGALADANRALELEPSDPAFQLQRGKVLAQMAERPEWAGRLEEAIEALSEAVRLAPDLAEAYDWRAYARLQAGDEAGELADLDALVRLEPDNPDAYRRRCECRQALGDRAGAALDWLYFCGLNPAAQLIPPADAAAKARAAFKKFGGN